MADWLNVPPRVQWLDVRFSSNQLIRCNDAADTQDVSENGHEKVGTQNDRQLIASLGSPWTSAAIALINAWNAIYAFTLTPQTHMTFNLVHQHFIWWHACKDHAASR